MLSPALYRRERPRRRGVAGRFGGRWRDARKRNGVALPTACAVDIRGFSHSASSLRELQYDLLYSPNDLVENESCRQSARLSLFEDEKAAVIIGLWI
ncbi:unnamed protein product [Urochloa humidicola]